VKERKREGSFPVAKAGGRRSQLPRAGTVKGTPGYYWLPEKWLRGEIYSHIQDRAKDERD